jgi:hypothetical protein
MQATKEVHMDTGKVGIAAAKAMDRIDKLREAGELTEEHELAEVLVIAAFNVPEPLPIEEDRMETLVFVDGTTQLIYVQEGLLNFARQVVGTGDTDD